MELDRVSLVLLGLVIVIGAFAMRLWGQASNMEAVHEAQLQAAQMELEKERIEAADSAKALAQAELREERDEAAGQRDVLRDSVDVLREERRANRIAVHMLDTDEQLKARFLEVFPEVAASDWGLMDIYNEAADLDISYMCVPSRFAETFIAAEEDAVNLEGQVGLQDRVITLGDSIIDLQRRIQVLEEERRVAYQNGYNSAYNQYQALNATYIDELQKPRLGLRVSSGAMGFLAGAIAGALISN